MHLHKVFQEALQAGFLKHLGDVLLDLVSVCSVSSCPSDRLMMIRSDLCVEHWLLSDKNITGLLQLMAKLMFGNVN